MPSKSHKPATSAGESYRKRLTPSELRRTQQRIRERCAELVPVVKEAAEKWRAEMTALGVDLPASVSSEALEHLARVVRMSAGFRRGGDWTAGDVLALAHEWVAEQRARAEREAWAGRLGKLPSATAEPPAPAAEGGDGGPAPRGVAPRNRVFLAWYETTGATTHHSHAAIRERWNTLSREQRAVICPDGTGKVARATVIKGIERAKKERGAKRPANRKPRRREPKRT